jgi:hypothetical protein
MTGTPDHTDELMEGAGTKSPVLKEGQEETPAGCRTIKRWCSS